MLKQEVKDKILQDLKKAANSLVSEIEKDCSAKLGKDKIKRTEQIMKIAWTIYETLLKETKVSFRDYHEDIIRQIENQW